MWDLPPYNPRHHLGWKDHTVDRKRKEAMVELHKHLLTPEEYEAILQRSLVGARNMLLDIVDVGRMRRKRRM